jgi:hypothetical protein
VRRHVAFGSALLAVLIAAPSGTAHAQTTAAAEALFDKGLEDMLAGKYDTGCPALAESYRLEPKAGALFTLAECENKAGKLASARAHYDDYLRLFAGMSKSEQAAQRGRDQAARDQRAGLEGRVPHLTLELPDDAPPETVVRFDGTRFERPALGLPLPVDPGSHVIEVEVPGRPAKTLSVELGEGEKRVVLLALPAAAEEVAVAPPPVAAPPAAGPDDIAAQGAWLVSWRALA